MLRAVATKGDSASMVSRSLEAGRRSDRVFGDKPVALGKTTFFR